MQDSTIIILVPLLLLTGIIVSYFDVYQRRIPNWLSVSICFIGLSVNSYFNHLPGILFGLKGALLAFCLMLVLHLFGTMGAGDVKLFAGVGALIGIKLVPMTFLIILSTGLLMALAFAIYQGTARVTAERVGLIFGGILSGAGVPRFPIPDNKKLTLPYGVAISLGTLISLCWHRFNGQI